MSKGARRTLRVIAALAITGMAVAIGLIVSVLYSYWQGQNAYDKVADTAFSVPLEDIEAAAKDGASVESLLDSMKVDWNALRAVNPDVVGWVYMPGTPINYPVVQGDDNTNYLYVNFNGEYGNGEQATYGTPFLMAQSSSDFSDRNNVIQSHNMANGTMFAWIANAALNDPNSLNDYRTVYLLTPAANYRLTSVSVLICDANDEISRTEFTSDDDFSAFVQRIVGRSVTAFDPAGPDAQRIGRLVSLSTCTSDGAGQRCVLVCAVTEYADAQVSLGSAGDAAAGDVDASASIGEAAGDYAQ